MTPAQPHFPPHLSFSQHSFPHLLPTLNLCMCPSSCLAPPSFFLRFALCSPAMKGSSNVMSSASPSQHALVLGHSWYSYNMCYSSLFPAPDPNWRIGWEFHCLDLPSLPNSKLHEGRYNTSWSTTTISLGLNEMPNT